jgi:hypothetical protein
MRVDLSNPRVAHHVGVIIPVHEAAPGAIAPYIPAEAVVTQDTTPVGRPAITQRWLPV